MQELNKYYNIWKDKETQFAIGAKNAKRAVNKISR